MATATLPTSCPSCQAKRLKRHCQPGHGRCDWLRCSFCKTTIAVIGGKVRTAK